MSKLTAEKLYSHAWRAADILRGSVDPGDYKGYIFGFLFLKRLSDVFEEEALRIEDETGDHHLAWEDPDEHVFFVPERARWVTLSKVNQQIGEALNKACGALEEKNPTLEGVLLNIDFNDPQRLGDSANRDSVLGRLLQHFSSIRLRNDDLEEPDVLGRAYEYLIEKFAEQAGKKGGEFYTPRKVVQLITELLSPTEGMRISDPTVGSGGMLIECAHYVANKGGDPRNLTLAGQEKNLGTWAICKMNMLLHGLPDADIRKGDTIRSPQLLEGGELMLFDRVIANPPFSLDEWGQETAKEDGFGRFRYGVPPKSRGDMAFLQHMIATTRTNGMVGVVMPHGVLFRGGSEAKIREGILRDDLLEAVIALPANLFYGTPIPATILVINQAKPKKRQRKVLFVDASAGFEQMRNQNKLRDKDIKRILGAFRGFKDEERYCRVVGMDEIEENDWNLNLGRYVDTTTAEERIDVQQALHDLRQLEEKRNEAAARMDALLKEMGYEI